MHPLLIPRYICIAPDGVEDHYPDSPFKVGDVLNMKHFELDAFKGCGYSLPDGSSMLSPLFFDSYPHLFRSMPWYEGRDKKQMKTVEYIRHVKNGEVIKVARWSDKLDWAYGRGFAYPLSSGMFEPATLTDYENYKKQIV